MGARRSVVFVTCAEVPDGAADDLAVEPLLHEAGIDLAVAVWDDPAVDWHRDDLAVVRSTWDYPRRRREFLAWAAAVPRLANPCAALAWSSDKHYLSDLAAAGVPCVASHFVEVDDSDGAGLRAAFEAVARDEADIVVKPAVGAGSIDAARYPCGDPDGRAAAHVTALRASGRAVLIQPYLASVDRRGETAVVFLGGAFSHAIRKEALLDGPPLSTGLFKQEVVAATIPTPAEVALAERALAAAPVAARSLLYARVDLLEVDGGSPLVLECELVEASLFLAEGVGAADRFAGAIVELLGGGGDEMVD
jgi:glutathione synthase/RimK-type ligase-like ATP-grasp enzyme